jgi:hypothetical protein
MLEDFAESHQIVRPGQLPTASFEKPKAKSWLCGLIASDRPLGHNQVLPPHTRSWGP